MANKLIKNSRNGRYLVTKSFVTTSYTAWTIQLKMITEATLNACTLVNTVANDQEVKCFRLDLNANGSLNLKINTGVSGDNWTSDQTSSVYLDTNTEYWLRIKYANTQDYTVEYSIDGTTYISTGILITSASLCYYTANQYVNFIPSIDSTYFNGILDTSEVQIIYSSGGSDITLFNGAAASNTGIYNVGSTIINNIATFTSADTYIKCNGMMLGNNNVSLISKIKIVSLPSGNEKQPIFVNVNGQGIYLILEDGYYKLSLKLSDSYLISLPINNDREFWIGYYYKNSYHKFGIIPYNKYNNFESLPAFDDTVEERCLQKWDMQSVAGETSWIKDYLLIGADGEYWFKGEIDLSKTFLSNNIASYRGYKQGYLPAIGTRLVDENTIVSELTLEQMYEVQINFVDNNGNPVNIGSNVVNFTINRVTNTYNNYFQKTDNNYRVYVPANSNVYADSNTLIASNVMENKTITITFYTLTINPEIKIGTADNMTIQVNAVNGYNNYIYSSTNTLYYIPNGSDVTYSVSKTNYTTVTGTIPSISENTIETPRLKYSEYILIEPRSAGVHSIKTLVLPNESINFKFTLHGSIGYGGDAYDYTYKYGGYAQATYTIPANATINALGLFTENMYECIGTGIKINNNVLLVAGGAGLITFSGGYGGSGYVGGYGSVRSGYSIDGSRGNAQENEINANGGNFTNAYGGTGNAFTVSGVTVVSEPTLRANDSSEGRAYIKIEEI